MSMSKWWQFFFFGGGGGGWNIPLNTLSKCHQMPKIFCNTFIGFFPFNIFLQHQRCVTGVHDSHTKMSFLPLSRAPQTGWSSRNEPHINFHLYLSSPWPGLFTVLQEPQITHHNSQPDCPAALRYQKINMLVSARGSECHSTIIQSWLPAWLNWLGPGGGTWQHTHMPQ